METFKKFLLASLGIICAVAIAAVVFLGLIYILDEIVG
jgi:hypothetical protein